MAGTNRTLSPHLGGPAIILVQPQLGENIGTVARAMLNCGLTDLRLVRPRDAWPNERAIAAASGAIDVLESAKLFDSTAEAVADLTLVYATSARSRDMAKAVVTPRQAALEMRVHDTHGAGCGLLMGPERTGLVNDDIALADALLNVPLNPAFCSLNLAQAVLLVGYEWFQSGNETTPPREFRPGQSRLATKAELVNFFEHLERELDPTGFFAATDKKPGMIRNIRNAFQRMTMTEQEVRSFHGIITALVGRKKARE